MPSGMDGLLPPGLETDREVLSDGKVGEYLPPLRHVTHARKGPRLGLPMGDVVALIFHFARGAGCSPMTVFNSVVFPTPLRPIRAMTLPSGISISTLEG